MARHEHSRSGKKGGNSHIVKKEEKYFYTASISWEKIFYIVIFSRGGGCYIAILPGEIEGNGTIQHW